MTILWADMTEPQRRNLDTIVDNFAHWLERMPSAESCAGASGHWSLSGCELYAPGMVDSETADQWEVYTDVIIPGRHTMPNGDPGYPDDYDVNFDSAHPTLWDALKRIGAIAVDLYVDAAAESESFAAYADELERGAP